MLRSIITVALLALVVGVAPAQTAPQAPSASLILDEGGPIRLGSVMYAGLSSSNMPAGSYWSLMASADTGHSSMSLGQTIVPLGLGANVVLTSGTVASGTWAQAIQIPNVPQLLGVRPVFRMIVWDGSTVALSNLAISGPIIQDILY